MLMMRQLPISMAARAVSKREDALVEAEGRLHLLLELGVVPEVVGRERLFDEEQVEGVELLQLSPCRPGCRRRWRPPGAGCPGYFSRTAAQASTSQPGLIFSLTAAVALAEVGADPLDEVGEGVLDAAAHAGLDLVPDAAVELRERHARLLGLEVPEGELEPALGHQVAPEAPGLGGISPRAP